VLVVDSSCLRDDRLLARAGQSNPGARRHTSRTQAQGSVLAHTFLQLKACSSCGGVKEEAPVASLTPDAALALQRWIGNAAVARLLAGPGPQVREGEPPSPPEIRSVQRLAGEFLAPTPEEGSVLAATPSGRGLISNAFEVHARLIPAGATESCTPGQYRQFVKGEFRKDGVPQEHGLDSGPMERDKYREDIIERKRYGYRGSPFGATSAYFTDKTFSVTDTQKGCFYKNWDQPSSGNAEDDEIDLQFRGHLINTQDDSILAERQWSVYGTTRAPLSEDEGAAPGPKKKKKKKKMCPGCIIS